MKPTPRDFESPHLTLTPYCNPFERIRVETRITIVSLQWRGKFSGSDYRYRALPDLTAKATSCASKWALALGSIRDAFNPASFTSLEASLRGITSPHFEVIQATVTEVAPFEIIPAPVLPPAEVKKEGEQEQKLNPEFERVSRTFREAKEWLEQFTVANPEVMQDPEYQNRITHFLENKKLRSIADTLPDTPPKPAWRRH